MSADDELMVRRAPGSAGAKPHNAAALEDSISALIAEIQAARPPGGRIVFVSGNFNVIHPGHLRLLNFAKQSGEMLVVGVNADALNNLALLNEDLRLENVRAIGVVDSAFVLRIPPDLFISRLRPEFVVKGKEHETRVNFEAVAVKQYGGKLLFSSGDIRYSSLDLLRQELYQVNHSTITKVHDFPSRHDFKFHDLIDIVRRFAGLSVVVVGDLIVDEYVTCDALGMSQEDPTLVVTPIRSDRFVGGAGIVAGHAAGLGANVRYFTVAGADPVAHFAAETLAGHKVKADLLVDPGRPTTYKQRYRASNKTLLRVNHLRQLDISNELATELVGKVVPAIAEADLVIFSDFNYGCLPQWVVDSLIAECKRRDVFMVADSQTSSQAGDVSRFSGAYLLTPTELEARVAMRDFQSGLIVLAHSLQQKADARHVILTLGAEGILIHTGDDDGHRQTDRLPAFNSTPKDVAGAGDSLLVCAALATAAGADIWQSAYIGSVAAACQVGRLGNMPLSADELVTELSL